MKPAFISLLLALAACEFPTEPPAPKLPHAPDDTGPAVIVGRVVYGPNAIGLQGANVRVVEAGVSVGTDDAGRYRVVLPAHFRGRTVPLNVRAIGFNTQTILVAIPGNGVTVNVGLSVSTMLLSCTMGVPPSAVHR